MRLSLKESRMKSLNATNLDRKSGIRGPKTMGEALRQLLVRFPHGSSTKPLAAPTNSAPAAPGAYSIGSAHPPIHPTERKALRRKRDRAAIDRPPAACFR